MLIGLGVGVDYALFIVTRHRSAVLAAREDAAVNAVCSAGRAVLFAGLTVAIALLGQLAVGISFLKTYRAGRRTIVRALASAWPGPRKQLLARTSKLDFPAARVPGRSPAPDHL